MSARPYTVLNDQQIAFRNTLSKALRIRPDKYELLIPARLSSHNHRWRKLTVEEEVIFGLAGYHVFSKEHAASLKISRETPVGNRWVGPCETYAQLTHGTEVIMSDLWVIASGFLPDLPDVFVDGVVRDILIRGDVTSALELIADIEQATS